jgi:hypothetical protein
VTLTYTTDIDVSTAGTHTVTIGGQSVVPSCTGAGPSTCTATLPITAIVPASDGLVPFSIMVDRNYKVPQTIKRKERIMEFKIPVTQESLCKAVLTILNFKLGLSEKEVEVLAVMLNHRITVVDSSARLLIRKVLDRDKFSTNNYIKRLKDKKILIQDGKTLSVNPSIIALASQTTLTFNFIL